MNIIKTICTATAVLLAGMLTSCSDYLDVSKELAKNLDKEEVFSKLNISNNGMRNFIRPVRIIRKQVWMCKVQMELLMRKLSILEKLFVLILMY